MRKACIAIFMAVLLVLGQVSVFAAPEVVTPGALGNSTDLIAVTKPKNQKDSTFDSSYIISGYGRIGTSVSFYVYSSADDVYKKIYNTTQVVDSNGNVQDVLIPSEIKIGSSGLFLNTVSLTQGDNDILVRAENGESVQYLKLLITKYNYNLIDFIKSLTN
jgi:hypothetical protein